MGFRLERFVQAQDAGFVYSQAVAELRAGRKRSHWMWFVFPQLAGLGRSPMAQAYAISGLAEAREYLAHPVLGERLIECAEIVAGLERADAEEIFGATDAIKLRSSMTLFAAAAPQREVFQRVLDGYYGGLGDEATVRLLGSG